MHNSLCTTHYELCAMRYALCTMYYALCTMHYAPCTMHYALWNMHYALCTIHYALFTMHYTLCTMQYAFGKMLQLLCLLCYMDYGTLHYALWFYYIFIVNPAVILLYILWKLGKHIVFTKLKGKLWIANLTKKKNKKNSSNTDIIYVRQQCIPIYNSCVQWHHTEALPTSQLSKNRGHTSCQRIQAFWKDDSFFSSSWWKSTREEISVALKKCSP